MAGFRILGLLRHVRFSSTSASGAISCCNSSARSVSTDQRFKDASRTKIFEAGNREEIDLTIDTLTEAGIGRGVHNGRNILVPCVLPGENVRAQLYSYDGKSYSANLLEVLSPNAHRVKPQCRLFGQCAGCQLQHASMALQLQFKTEKVRRFYNEIGNFADVDHILKPMIYTDQAYEYRTKITPKYVLRQDGSQVIGFERIGDKSILDVDHCAISTQSVNDALIEVRRDKIRPKNAKFRRGSLNIRDNAGGKVALDYKTPVAQVVGDLTFWFPSGSFFQINKYAVAPMVNYVIQQAFGHGCTQLVDTYCGAGLFALCAAKLFHFVIGVEISKESVQWASENAKANKIMNASFVAADSANIFASLQKEHANSSVVIVDPPRVGCSDDFLKHMFEFRPKKIVYISCDPSTQARDARVIVDNGYQLVEITPVDLFPQTKHIEAVATFLLATSK